MPNITRRELYAVAVAWDELVSYLEAIGPDADLDDEEMPQTLRRDAANDLRRLLLRHGILDVNAVIV